VRRSFAKEYEQAFVFQWHRLLRRTLVLKNIVKHMMRLKSATQEKLHAYSKAGYIINLEMEACTSCSILNLRIAINAFAALPALQIAHELA
jgi:hypothetical protein